MRPKVFGAGLIALDMVISRRQACGRGEAERLVGCWAGGTCGNVLTILAWLGWDAFPISRMNGDVASRRVGADMAQWGVHLDWANCSPATDTPIIVEEIRCGRDGRARHRFSWLCPHCGSWLPPFKAITLATVERLAPVLAGASVFFLDRLSRATLRLAAEAAAGGALVVFEPSARAADKLMAEAATLAHIVKYANDRLDCIPGVMADGSSTLLEVQTFGEGGLRYRHRLGHGISNWMHLPAAPAVCLADACGAGDWCTAGLIAKVAAGGRRGLRRAGARGVRAALRYGQALAAWNCGFEGARGGMYVVPRAALDRQIQSVLMGQAQVGNQAAVASAPPVAITCPACP